MPRQYTNPRAAAYQRDFEIFGLTCNATLEEVKAAYKERIIRCHPDKARDKKTAHLQTQALNNARDNLFNYFDQKTPAFVPDPPRDSVEAQFLQALLNHDQDTLQRLVANCNDQFYITKLANLCIKQAHSIVVNEVFTSLLRKCARIDGMVEATDTLLQSAIKKGAVAYTELLLQFGADIRQVDRSGNTVLHLAAQNPNKEIIRSLLAHGAHARATNTVKETPLHKIGKKCSPEIYELLIQAGADPLQINALGNTVLHQAAAHADSELIQYLLSKGVPLDAKNIIDETPLHLAARHDNLKACQGLLQASAQVNARTIIGKTALHYAKSKKIVNCLVKAGIRIEEKTELKKDISYLKNLSNELKTLPQDYVKHLDRETTDLIADSIYDLILTQFIPGKTALHYTATNGIFKREQASLMRALLKAGARVDAKDSEGNTPLHLLIKGTAIYKFDKPFFLKLIQSGADINARNYKGETVLSLAISQGRTDNTLIEDLQFLLEQGADPSIGDYTMRTPLQKVAFSQPFSDWMDSYNPKPPEIQIRKSIIQLLNKINPKLIFSHVFLADEWVEEDDQHANNSINLKIDMAQRRFNLNSNLRMFFAFLGFHFLFERNKPLSFKGIAKKLFGWEDNKVLERQIFNIIKAPVVALINLAFLPLYFLMNLTKLVAVFLPRLLKNVTEYAILAIGPKSKSSIQTLLWKYLFRNLLYLNLLIMGFFSLCADVILSPIRHAREYITAFKADGTLSVLGLLIRWEIGLYFIAFMAIPFLLPIVANLIAASLVFYLPAISSAIMIACNTLATAAPATLEMTINLLISITFYPLMFLLNSISEAFTNWWHKTGEAITPPFTKTNTDPDTAKPSHSPSYDNTYAFSQAGIRKNFGKQKAPSTSSPYNHDRTSYHSDNNPGPSMNQPDSKNRNNNVPDCAYSSSDESSNEEAKGFTPGY